MRDHERAMTALYAGLHARLMGHVTRAATGEGQTVPPQDSQAVRNAVSGEVLALFAQPVGRQAPAPFNIVSGRVMPASPYMLTLWPFIEDATRLAVEAQAAIMRRSLRRAPDLVAVFERARRNPMAVARRVSEQDFPRRPFLTYDPAHRFVDPRGYRLSDRIWDVGASTRRKIDQLLAEMIAEGRGSLEISRELEQFLNPRRLIARTRKPYGRNASYDGMRLGRTEITAAGARAHRMAALMNPFVEEYDFVLSNSHKILDECDAAADGSPYRWDDDSAPHIPLHPQDMCHERDRVVENAGEIIGDLRGEMSDPPDDSLLLMITPLLVERFTRILLDEPELQPEEWY
jgi:hypothetical protein